METEGPGSDSQKRHIALVAPRKRAAKSPALVAQLVERRSYTNVYTHRALGECRGFNPHLEHLFLCQSLIEKKMFLFFLCFSKNALLGLEKCCTLEKNILQPYNKLLHILRFLIV